MVFLLCKKHSVSLILGVIVVLALFFRIFQLGTMPAGFLEDEAHIGYNAYSLLHTLKDKNGVLLPLSIDQFGDFRPSGLHFLTAPSVAVFGLTKFATRLPVAVFGGLSVLVFFYLTLEIFGSKRVSLFAAGLMAINPWSFGASRTTSESIVALFFVMLGVTLLLVYLRKSQEKAGRFLFYPFLGFLSLLLSFQFYHAARYFVPFIVGYIFLWVVFGRSLRKHVRITIIIGSLLLAVGLMLLMKFGGGLGRVDEVSIFQNPKTSIALWKQKSEDKGMPPLVVQFFHNKYASYAYTAAVNYGEHFTPDFLFFYGGFPLRYQIPWSGEYYPIEAIFMVIGVSLLFAKLFQERHMAWPLGIPLIWLIAGPIPAAFTFEDIPHFQRSIMMMPALILFSAYGLFLLLTRFKKYARLAVGIIVFAVFFYQVAVYAHNYFHHSLTHDAQYRYQGEQQLIKAEDSYVKQGRPVIATSQGGNHVIFYLFYNKIDPHYFQSIGSPQDKNNLTFDGILFKTTDCPSYDAESQITPSGYNTVFVDNGACLSRSETKLLENIYHPDGTVAYRIMELKPAYQGLALSKK